MWLTVFTLGLLALLGTSLGQNARPDTRDLLPDPTCSSISDRVSSASNVYYPGIESITSVELIDDLHLVHIISSKLD